MNNTQYINVKNNLQGNSLKLWEKTDMMGGWVYLTVTFDCELLQIWNNMMGGTFACELLQINNMMGGTFICELLQINNMMEGTFDC